MPTRPPPCTLDEAVERLLRVLTPEGLTAFAARPDEGVVQRHFTLGWGVRHNFGLWNQSSAP